MNEKTREDSKHEYLLRKSRKHNSNLSTEILNSKTNFNQILEFLGKIQTFRIISHLEMSLGLDKWNV